VKFLSPIDNVEDFSTGTFAASFTPDISSSAIVKVTLTGNITSLNAPTGRNFGIFTIVFVQDATGSRTVTWNTTDYPAFSIGSWQPSDVANSISSISLLWDSASSKWRPFSSWNGSLLTGNIYIGKNGASTIQMAGTFVASDLRTNGTIQSNTFQGDTASGGNLNLLSTTHATKGKIYLGGGGNNSAFDETNKRLGIGNVSPSTALDVTGAGTFSSTVTAADPTSSTHLATKNYVDTQGGTSLKGRMSSDMTSLNATAFTDVTGLSVSLPSTGYYKFSAFIPFRATAGTGPTVMFGVTGPTSVVCQYSVVVQTGTTGTASSVAAGAYLQNSGLSGSVTTLTTFGAVVTGFVEVSATGTLKVQYKTGGTSQLFSIFTGGMFTAEKILY
jgi:hypothetical protein